MDRFHVLKCSKESSLCNCLGTFKQKEEAEDFLKQNLKQTDSEKFFLAIYDVEAG